MAYTNKEWSLLNSFTECITSTPAELDLIVKVIYEDWDPSEDLRKAIDLVKTELEQNYDSGRNFKDAEAYELGIKLLQNEDKITHLTGYSILASEQKKLMKKRISSNLTEEERTILRNISNLYR